MVKTYDVLPGLWPCLRMDFFCRDNADGYGGQVADEYAVLIKALWSGQYKSVMPKDFRVRTKSTRWSRS